jgi:GAF domain-containing protein
MQRKYFGRLRVGRDELIREERSLVGYVAATKQPRRSDDVVPDQFYRASNEETRSELAVPVLFKDEVLAVINLGSTKAAFFDEEHQDFLQLVARLIAFPLHSLMVGEGIRRPIVDALDSLGKSSTSIPPSISLEASGVLNEILS